MFRLPHKEATNIHAPINSGTTISAADKPTSARKEPVARQHGSGAGAKVVCARKSTSFVDNNSDVIGVENRL